METKHNFKPIPLSEIDDLAKNIAIEWCENYTPHGSIMPEIAQKQKLASDIIHYSRIQNADLLAKVSEQDEVIAKLKSHVVEADEFIIHDLKQTQRVEQLEEALSGVLNLIDSGVLVRDISKDHEPGWAIKQLPLIQTLAKAKSLLSKFNDEKS